MFGFEHYVILLMKVFAAYFNWSIIALNIQNTTFDFDICYDFIKDYFGKSAVSKKNLQVTVNMALSIFDISTVFKIKLKMTSHYQEDHVRFELRF